MTNQIINRRKLKSNDIIEIYEKMIELMSLLLSASEKIAKQLTSDQLNDLIQRTQILKGTLEQVQYNLSVLQDEQFQQQSAPLVLRN